MVAPTHATRKNAPFSAPTKNVGADSISARARLRQDKPPRAHIECAPTDLVFDIGLAGSGGYNKKESVTSKMPQTLGARYRTRTCDLLHVKQMLYQLS